MPLVSYAQNREDVLLYRALSGQPKGFYIDVGANDPTVCSITKCFYDKGWHGINIEPVRSVFQRLAAERTRDINLNIGISSCRQILTFYECLSESTLSTFSPASAAWWAAPPRGYVFKERQVPVMTLAQVCEQYVRQPIDFLSIDAEMHERAVIEGQDWKRWRPRIVVVEDGVSSETGRTCHDQWEPYLLRADYLFAFFDGVNRFYVRKEDEHLLRPLQVPANSTDNFIVFERECLTKELARWCGQDELGPVSLMIVRKLREWARHYPRTSAAAKRLVRFVLTDSRRARAS
jgi:FkbM family methyltransferase